MKTKYESPISLSSCFPGNIKTADNTGHQLREQGFAGLLLGAIFAQVA
jgi:hypothetical protein